ncbi:MAG: hypothetical protein CME16_00765 [Gemmatimonadetes bacterium]|nr:hypothetical protein [Gemmatimonadota bacterium]
MLQHGRGLGSQFIFEFINLAYPLSQARAILWCGRTGFYLAHHPAQDLVQFTLQIHGEGPYFIEILN